VGKNHYTAWVVGARMSVEELWNYTDTGITEALREKTIQPVW